MTSHDQGMKQPIVDEPSFLKDGPDSFSPGRKPLSSAPTILKMLYLKKITPKQLTSHMRRICIKYLLHERTYSQVQIAEILKCSQSAVVRHAKEIRKHSSYLVDEIDEKSIMAEMLGVAEASMTRLYKMSKPREAWTVFKEMVEKLQSFGIITRKPIEFEGKLTLMEILGIVAMESKKSGEITEDERSAFLEKTEPGGNGTPATENNGAQEPGR